MKTIIVKDKLFDRIMLGWTLVTAERLADKIEAAEAYLGDAEPTYQENELLTVTRKRLAQLRKDPCVTSIINSNTSSPMTHIRSDTSKEKLSSGSGE